MRHFLISLLLISSAAHAENWQQIANLESGGGVLSVDTDSIDRGSDVRKAWFKAVYNSDRLIGNRSGNPANSGRSYRWESKLGHFNCAERTMALSEAVLYGADDKVVGRVGIDPKSLKFREVTPQNISGVMFQAVCGSPTPGAQPKPGLPTVTDGANPFDYYPAASRRRQEQGTPIVQACVDASGALLREPEIVMTSGFPELDAAAIKVAKASKYAAGLEQGVPRPESCIKFKVKFVLTE